MDNVTPQKLKEEMDKGTGMTIVDLQPPEKYNHTHVPGAVNIPIETFTRGYPDLLKDTNWTVVLYGEFDDMGKSKKAGKILEEKGYTQVGRLEGGLRGWQEAGYMTERGIES